MSKWDYIKDSTFDALFTPGYTNHVLSLTTESCCVYIIVDRSDYDNPTGLEIVADAYYKRPSFGSSVAGINFDEKEYKFKGVVRIRCTKKTP